MFITIEIRSRLSKESKQRLLRASDTFVPVNIVIQMNYCKVFMENGNYIRSKANLGNVE